MSPDDKNSSAAGMSPDMAAVFEAIGARSVFDKLVALFQSNQPARIRPPSEDAPPNICAMSPDDNNGSAAGISPDMAAVFEAMGTLSVLQLLFDRVDDQGLLLDLERCQGVSALLYGVRRSLLDVVAK
jgi:hypothetical protein